MHEFKVGDKRYGAPDPVDFEFGDDTLDELDVRLSGLISESSGKTRWIYEYDFGDGWRHEILFEGFASNDPKVKYPLCEDGKRACPPEDCGGPWGYVEYLAAIADPKHEQHKEMRKWRGRFDPEAFDVDKATKAMRKVKL